MPQTQDERNQQMSKILYAHIDLRVRNQAYYSISKILACSAILGVILQRQQFGIEIMVVALISIFLDFIILHNLAIVNDIGRYIRNEIERENPGYATKIAQTQKARTRDLLDRIGQFGITAVFTLFSCFAHVKYNHVPRIPSWEFVIVAIVALFLVVDLVLALRIRPQHAPSNS